MTGALPLWRSLLYVPAHVERFVGKAHERGADCVVLDLEDSVPLAEKERARALIGAAATRVRRCGADVVVRINRPLALAVRDLEAAIGPQVDGICVTKTESAEHLRLLGELVSELEAERGLAPGHTRFLALVESPAAFMQMAAIARAPRVVALMLGGEDFALEVGMEPAQETLLMPKQQMILAARAAGVMPLGFIDSIASFGDREAFRAMARRSRRFGFAGATCIHPDQVAIVNDEYAPSASDLAQARRVLAGHEDALAQGRGAFAIGGVMVDAPVVERARRLLARHALIEGR
jgi:citrate lyase subunit beta/citryl-CoA lyase